MKVASKSVPPPTFMHISVTIEIESDADGRALRELFQMAATDKDLSERSRAMATLILPHVTLL